MSNTIQIKRSSTSGSVPTAGQLAQGELAVNLADEALYTKDASGAVVKLNAPSIDDKNTGATKRVTIDPSGNFLVGVTAPPTGATGGSGFIVESDGRRRLELATTTTAARALATFYNPNGVVGSIQTSASSTSYVTSSDYRLKHDIQPMTGALAKVAQLKPVTYKWNADDSQSQGFIAHELQEVVPECVTGEKDAVDAEGNPQYQGIDTSFLVATLTAALQEAHGLIKDLQARVDALEGN
jgi:hypothetical protein